MDFYFYSLFAVSLWELWATYSDLLKIRKSECIEGTIVGYKFSGMPIWKGILLEFPSRFWPVIEHSCDGKAQTFAAKKFSVFLPVGSEVKGRFCKGKLLSLNSPHAAYIFVIIIWFAMLHVGGDRLNALFIILFVYISFQGFGDYWLRRKLGKRHTFYKYQSLEKPENFSVYKEEDIKSIESKDLVSYEEAHIHQYYTRKKKKVDLISNLIIICMGVLLICGVWQEISGE